MPKQSAGVLLYRPKAKGFEVLLVHPGGPFWAKKDKGAWSIPKGEYQAGEDPLDAAKREFSEETGNPLPAGELLDLGEVKQPSGKLVRIWALAADFNLEKFKSNTFEMEWPPRSGTMQEFPEADKAAWLSLDAAMAKLTKGQLPFLEQLATHLGVAIGPEPEAASPQTSLFG